MSAGQELCMLDPEAFPEDLRIDFTRIRDQITRKDSIADGVATMSDGAVRDVVESVWNLATEVARRAVIEDMEEETEDG